MTTQGGTALPKIPQVRLLEDSSPDPLIGLATRFLDKVHIELEDPFNYGCWFWRGRCDDQGYGQFRAYGTIHNAHRIAWMLKHRRWPGRWHIRHTCDNRNCVNPDHLKRGTKSQNERDKHNKRKTLWENQHGKG